MCAELFVYICILNTVVDPENSASFLEKASSFIILLGLLTRHWPTLNRENVLIILH